MTENSPKLWDPLLQCTRASDSVCSVCLVVVPGQGRELAGTKSPPTMSDS